MINLDSSKSQIFSSVSNESNQKVLVNSQFPCKKDANNYQITDYVDLTEDDRCFICDKVISRAFYSLAKTMTFKSKNLIAHKLGKLAGKKCLVIVSEDDYICQNCVNLFNQLESAEIQLKITKDCIKKHLEQKYLSSDKIHTVPNDVYAALNLLATKDAEIIDEPLKKEKCVESRNILKEICLKNCNTNNINLVKVSPQTVSSQQFDYSSANIENHPECEYKVLRYDEPISIEQ